MKMLAEPDPVLSKPMPLVAEKKTPVAWTEMGGAVARTVAALPAEQSAVLMWLYQHAMAEAMTAAETARAVGIDTATLSKVLNGRYAAGLDGVLTKIQNYRALWEKRVEASQIGFVTTGTTQQIWQACDWAHASQSITLIFGDSQSGKTKSLMQYAKGSAAGKADHARYVRMPAAGSSQLMLGELMAACRLTDGRTFDKMRSALLRTINDRHLLIVDELHQVFLTYKQNQALACVEVLREIHDLTGCGMVLCGTNVLSTEIKTGKMAPALAQLSRRGVAEICLPSVPPSDDVDKIAAAYGLPPARNEAARLLDSILLHHGLGKFIKYLQAATRFSAKEKEPLGWQHFLKAHAILEALRGGAK